MRKTHRQAPKSDNVYLKLLVKYYRFLARKLTILSRAYRSVTYVAIPPIARL